MTKYPVLGISGKSLIKQKHLVPRTYDCSVDNPDNPCYQHRFPVCNAGNWKQVSGPCTPSPKNDHHTHKRLMFYFLKALSIKIIWVAQHSNTMCVSPGLTVFELLTIQLMKTALFQNVYLKYMWQPLFGHTLSSGRVATTWHKTVECTSIHTKYNTKNTVGAIVANDTDVVGCCGVF